MNKTIFILREWQPSDPATFVATGGDLHSFGNGRSGVENRQGNQRESL
jgi:hypothetical protein